MQETKLKYIEYQNKFNTTKKYMQKLYYITRASNFTEDSKTLWSLINNVIKRTKDKGSIISQIIIDGRKTSNPEKIANEFGKFYSTLGNNLALQISCGPQSAEHYIDKIPRNLNSLVMRSITMQEIKNTINSLPNKTSSGHDGISNILLKSIGSNLVFPLHVIFNMSIAEGIFPKQMKMAEIIPLYKGKDIDLVINYRSFSLLITISKLLEKMVYSRVYKFLEWHNILYNSQFGFHNKQSCEHALMELCGKITKARDIGQHNTALFLDLSKVFNTFNHTMLLKKLD